mmetsp:Transcript_37854/g.52565  ORF Transcript_37854/g.52565 Transcript_37854/m.52565 type:complete len:239 (-) Transcript_37854:1003-1719(-)
MRTHLSPRSCFASHLLREENHALPRQLKCVNSSNAERDSDGVHSVFRIEGNVLRSQDILHVVSLSSDGNLASERNWSFQHVSKSVGYSHMVSKRNSSNWFPLKRVDGIFNKGVGCSGCHNHLKRWVFDRVPVGECLHEVGPSRLRGAQPNVIDFTKTVIRTQTPVRAESRRRRSCHSSQLGVASQQRILSSRRIIAIEDNAVFSHAGFESASGTRDVPVTALVPRDDVESDFCARCRD